MALFAFTVNPLVFPVTLLAFDSYKVVQIDVLDFPYTFSAPLIIPDYHTTSLIKASRHYDSIW